MGILCQKGCNWACRAIQGQTCRSRFFTSTWSQLFWHLRNSCALSIHLNCSGYCSRQKPWNSSDWHKRCILKWSTHLARNHIHAPTPRILNPWKPKPSVSSPKNFVWPKAVRQKVVSMACWNHDETGFFEVRSWPGCVLLMMCSSGFEGQSLTKCVWNTSGGPLWPNDWAVCYASFRLPRCARGETGGQRQCFGRDKIEAVKTASGGTGHVLRFSNTWC